MFAAVAANVSPDIETAWETRGQEFEFTYHPDDDAYDMYADLYENTGELVHSPKRP